MLGGLTGLVFSYGLVELAAYAFPDENAPIITSLALTVAFGCSVGIGILAGLIPAIKAARLDPIDALRYD
jgi:putative ABC transport system permease protein